MNLHDAINRGELNASLEMVISSRASAKGLERAAERGIATRLVASKDFMDSITFAGGKAPPNWDKMSAAINSIILPLKPDLVVLAGYLCLYRIPAELKGRVMNIHPALIPSFCGQGMWGHHVHEAVVKSGVKVTGCTVHFIDDAYDHGPIIIQRACPVCDTDTADDVAARVFKEECLAYPEAIRLFAEGRLEISGGKVAVRQ